jgi:hypothetical protein
VSYDTGAIFGVLHAALEYPCAPVEVVKLLLHHGHLAGIDSDAERLLLRTSLREGAPLELVKLFFAANPVDEEMYLSHEPEIEFFQDAKMNYLHKVVRSEHPCAEVVQFLIQTRPDRVSTPNSSGDLALHVAVEHGTSSLEVVKLLLDAHPQAIRHKNCRGMLPLHCALQCFVKGVPHGVFEMLFNAYPEAIHESIPEGESALSLALQHGTASERVVQTILELHSQNDFAESITPEKDGDALDVGVRHVRQTSAASDVGVRHVNLQRIAQMRSHIEVAESSVPGK